jgi:predicted 2-oxoglutarate/Fe(II)-dependent dioxygenase YbiX
MLSDLNEYEGGGTYFRSLKQTIKLRQGQVLVHPGELYHKGVDITKGTRLLIVGFMDGFDPKIIDDSTSRDEHEEYEANMYIY